MSYIRAKLVEVHEGEDVVTAHLEAPDVDYNLDDEILDFVLSVIGKINDLNKGEALVVWKDIF